MLKTISAIPSAADRRRLVEHYDALAPRYSTLYEGRSRLAHFYNVRQVRVKEWLETSHGPRLLEVGCGPGHLAPFVVGRRMVYCGIDLSPGMIKVCRETHEGLAGAHFAVGDTQALALPDAAFDVVLCLGMLEYVPREEVAIAEIARVLRPGGTCIISGINAWSPYNLWDRAVYRRLTRRRPVGIMHEYHGERDYRSWLQRRGLTIEDVVYFDFDLVLAPLDRYVPGAAVSISEWLEWCGRSWCNRLGNGFLMKATKDR